MYRPPIDSELFNETVVADLFDMSGLGLVFWARDLVVFNVRFGLHMLSLKLAHTSLSIGELDLYAAEGVERHLKDGVNLFERSALYCNHVSGTCSRGLVGATL